ncbi:hypothetical protein SAMN06295912_1401, partial [Sphingomonas laterariae]
YPDIALEVLRDHPEGDILSPPTPSREASEDQNDD